MQNMLSEIILWAQDWRVPYLYVQGLRCHGDSLKVAIMCGSDTFHLGTCSLGSVVNIIYI